MLHLLFFSALLYTYMCAMLKPNTYYDVYFPYLPCYPYMMVWIWVDMLRLVVLYLVPVYLMDESWMISVDVVIHPLRCGLAIVHRCQGLSKVICSGGGLVLHSVWQVLELVKHLFLGVDPLGQHVPPRVRYETGFLLIRELWVCVLFEINGKGMVIPRIRLVQEGLERGKP
jgi:hypothetical protein